MAALVHSAVVVKSPSPGKKKKRQHKTATFLIGIHNFPDSDRHSALLLLIILCTINV